MDQGRYAEADPLLKRALAIDEKALGPEHPDVGQSLNTSPLCTSTRAAMARPSRYSSEPSPSTKRRSAPTTGTGRCLHFCRSDWMDYLSGKGLIKNDSEQLWPRSSDAT